MYAWSRYHRGECRRDTSSTVAYFISDFQEIISEEIIDETDRYEDNHSKRRARRQFNASVMSGSVFHLC